MKLSSIAHLLACISLVLLGLNGPAALSEGLDSSDPFFQIVDTKRTNGFVEILRVRQGDDPSYSPPFNTIFSWDSGNFISEYFRVSNSVVTSNLVFSAGRYGTNQWDYRDGKLTGYGISGPRMAESQKENGGRMAAEYGLDIFLGRGLDIRQFSHLTNFSGVLHGNYLNDLTLEGRVVKRSDGSYFWEFTPFSSMQPLSVRFQFEVTLTNFANLGYLPLVLVAKEVQRGKTNILYEVHLLSCGVGTVRDSYYPPNLYDITSTFVVQNDATFSRSVNDHLVRLPTASEVKAIKSGQRSRGIRQAAVRIIIPVLVGVTTFLFFWWWSKRAR